MERNCESCKHLVRKGSVCGLDAYLCDNSPAGTCWYPASTAPTDCWEPTIVKKDYLVWSNEHNAWWGPDSCGYYPDVKMAGLYTCEEAEACCTSRSKVEGEPDPEIMVHRSVLAAFLGDDTLYKAQQDLKALKVVLAESQAREQALKIEVVHFSNKLEELVMEIKDTGKEQGRIVYDILKRYGG